MICSVFSHQYCGYNQNLKLVQILRNFHLLKQQFIELIREERHNDAFDFAQLHLKPFHEDVCFSSPCIVFDYRDHSTDCFYSDGIFKTSGGSYVSSRL